MIHVIVKITELCPGGDVTGIQYKTFALAHFGAIQDLEEFLLNRQAYENRSVIGVEVLP